MLAYLRSPAFLARVLDALVGADARPQALLALAPLAVMLAYLRSPAFLAPALDALVGADARPQALLAPAPLAIMLAYLRSPAFLAPALDALVGADARPQALFAPAPDPVMLALVRRHSAVVRLRTDFFSRLVLCFADTCWARTSDWSPQRSLLDRQGLTVCVVCRQA